MVSRGPTEAAAPPRLVLRIQFGHDGVFGPGKAELLETIERLGSISAAARAMRISYRQAWVLLETMNQVFRGPVIETRQGGARGGGARLTRVGRQLVTSYRALQAKAAQTAGKDLRTITRLLGTGPAAPPHTPRLPRGPKHSASLSPDKGRGGAA